jgi:Lipopolysaccharide-assembly, LptC-related
MVVFQFDLRAHGFSGFVCSAFLCAFAPLREIHPNWKRAHAKPLRRKVVRKQCLTTRLLLVAILLAAVPLAWGNSGKKKNTAVPGSSVSPTPPRFNIPIPVSHDAEGVKLPYFDAHGRLQMYFNIALARRVDLDHLEMDNAYMQTYDEKGAPDATVFMTRSTLDLNTRIVTSDVPVTVHRADFEIIGQKMVFNTQTRKGQMTGHVRMTIYNRQEMSHASPSPSPSRPATP